MATKITAKGNAIATVSGIWLARGAWVVGNGNELVGEGTLELVRRTKDGVGEGILIVLVTVIAGIVILRLLIRATSVRCGTGSDKYNSGVWIFSIL